MNDQISTEPQNTETQPEQKQSSVVYAVSVQYRCAGDMYTFLTDDAELKLGEHVVVEGEHGDSIGMIITPPREVKPDDLPKNVRKVIRRASEDDLKELAKRREEARELFEMCEAKIEDHHLPMKLVDAEITEGGKKVIFFFFAEQRVDFRSLVKELASSLHRYIEMRQIGSRDASGFIGCLGPCGRTTCCSSYLRQFQSISISMAKNQGLSPNPLKLTGMCGKLKCCLAYENKAYIDLKSGLPKVGSWVNTPKGVGKVVSLDILGRRCSVKLDSGGEGKFECEECSHAEKPKAPAKEPEPAKREEQKEKQEEEGKKEEEL